MYHIFEIIAKDAAGRIGKLKTPHGVVETPTVMPVINPNLQTIRPSEMKEFGAEILITNSYIIYTRDELRERALKDGLHALLDYDGPLMTDSGSFQLSVYGDVCVTNPEIIDFEMKIGTDIGVPLDIPTAPDVTYEQASSELEITNERIAEARKRVPPSDGNPGSGMLLAGPVQGAVYEDLREKSGRFVSEQKCDVFPIGAVVPLMEAYRYAELVDVIVAAKRGLDPTVPVHLFGAGHPMMFALAVALGCDLFDSAAYALYAKAGRYITVNGTYHIDKMRYLPCSCPVCRGKCAEDIRSSPDRDELLARHNLYVTFDEIRRIKQAILDEKLLELVELRCHAHPKMLSALDALAAHADYLEERDLSTKSTFFECSAASAGRPEVLHHEKRLDRITVSGKVLIRPASGKADKDYDRLMNFLPPFGAYPVELEEVYPFNAEVTEQPSRASLERALKNTVAIIRNNPDAEFTFVKGRNIRNADPALFEELSTVCRIVESFAALHADEE
ncbi:MAG: tRNA guanosine(15) transglycosylase TgtA [Methanosarcinaceae archaeon]|nr:tRNA guanosine(15) transglycosylase TgtA [Methanosarcinaceae archaeon]